MGGGKSLQDKLTFGSLVVPQDDRQLRALKSAIARHFFWGGFGNYFVTAPCFVLHHCSLLGRSVSDRARPCFGFDILTYGSRHCSARNYKPRPGSLRFLPSLLVCIFPYGTGTPTINSSNGGIAKELS